MEDHVCRDALFAGLFGAPGPQGLEGGKQRLGQLVRDGLGLAVAPGGAGGPRTGDGRLLRLLAQRHLALAPQHGAARLGEHQRAVLPLDREEPLGQQLPDDPAPLALGEILADAEDGQLVVVELDHLAGALAEQDVDDLHRAELLPALPLQPHHRGEHLLRGDGAVPGLGRGEAGVAVAAGRGLGVLTEVGEQLATAALGGLAQGEHGVEVGGGPAAERLVALAGLDQLALLYDVVQAVRHPGRGRQTVAARPAGLLVVPLDRLGQVQVGDEAYVRLVDAHAEGDGRDHHQTVLAQEPGLVRRARGRVQARVVRHRRDAVGVEELGRALHRVAREAVHDAGVARVLLAEEGEELLPWVGLGHDPVLDVGPVEAGDEVPGRRQVQPLSDLLVGGAGGRGGEGDPRDVRPALAEQGEGEVVGAEVVAPLGHAVGLVDREDGDLAAGEQVQRGVHAQPLRRQVQQVQLAGQELGLDHAPLVEVLGGVDETGAHAEGAQGVHLVLHEGDQRRDDHARAGPDEGRDLVAERFAAARRHEDDGVTTRHHMLDDRLLLAPEGVVSEDPVQRGQRLAVGRARPLGHLCHLADPARHAHRPVPRRSPVCRLSTAASTIGVRTDSPGVIHRLGRFRTASVSRGRRDPENTAARRPPARVPGSGSGDAGVSARRLPPGSPGPGSTAAPRRGPA